MNQNWIICYFFKHFGTEKFVPRMLKILENCFKNHIAQVKESEQNGKDDLKTY